MSNDYKWTKVADDLPLYLCGYRFGAGHAFALAAPFGDGLAIVSPPCRAPDETYAGIEEHGRVRALVAPNGFHTLGLAPWKARFPDANVFAPAQSIARVAKRTGVAGIAPLADARTASGLELVEIPHYKSGEVLVRFKDGAHTVWYLTDVVLNLPSLPKQFPLKQIFGWTKSGPGLRPNGLAPLFMMKDKRAVYAWLRAEIDKAPPTILIAAHGGAIVERPAERLREILPA